MSAPAYTVIIPTHNRPTWLEVSVRAALTSAAHLRARFGTDLDVQVLVVDDVSDDDSAEVVARRCGVDYVRIEEHDGRNDPGASRVLGIQRANGDFYVTMDDDDALLPHHLSAVHEKVLQGFDVVTVSYQITDEDLVPDGPPTILPPPDLGDLLAGHVTINDSSAVRRSLVVDFEFDLDLEKVMLQPMWAELLLQERRFAVVTTPAWLYRRHSENMSLSALDERDLVRRARVREYLRQVTLDRWGHVPPSPIEERRAQAEHEAAQQALQAAQIEQERLDAIAGRAAEKAARLAARAEAKSARQAVRAREQRELTHLRAERDRAIAVAAAAPRGPLARVRRRLARAIAP